MGKADHPAFGDTSGWTDEDHAAANAQQERDLADLAGQGSADYPPERHAYNEGYMDGLQDAHATHARMAERRRVARRRAARLTLATGVAWLMGSAVGDTLAALTRWVDE